MGLLDNLGLGNILGGVNLGGLGNPLSKNVSPTQMPFNTSIVITDGDAAYDTMAEVLAIIGALAAGSVWTKIWEKTCEAQRTYRWGFGSPQTPYNQGYMWFASMDVTTDFQRGKLRLVQANANETKVFTVKELDDASLHLQVVTSLALATPVSKNDMIALPEKVEFPQVGEDSKLQLWYKCIAPATAEDQVGFSIPVTVRQ
jgi:hypothetical protein